MGRLVFGFPFTRKATGGIGSFKLSKKLALGAGLGATGIAPAAVLLSSFIKNQREENEKFLKEIENLKNENRLQNKETERLKALLDHIYRYGNIRSFGRV